MKILIVIPSFFPVKGKGGPPRSVYSLSKGIIKKGHEVVVYTTDIYDKYSRINFKKDITEIDGIKIHYFKNLIHWLAWKGIELPPSLPGKLKKNIESFDIIHANLCRNTYGFFVYYYAKKFNVPYIIQPRGSLPRMSKSNLKKFLDLIYVHSLFKNAKKIIASSEIESKQYYDVFQDLDKEKIVKIPNGINWDQYTNLPEYTIFRKKYSIGDNRIILFIGRLHERKGADILIKAFSRLKYDINDLKLIIAGPNDSYLNVLKNRVKKFNIQKDVIFPGPLYNRDKLEAYVSADVFVLPSKDKYESFGNVVLEASACGTTSVVTNVCGVTEYVKNIILVNPSVKSIEIGLRKGLREDNLGKKARIEVKRKCGWDKVCDKYIDTYRNIVNRG